MIIFHHLKLIINNITYLLVSFFEWVNKHNCLLYPDVLNGGILVVCLNGLHGGESGQAPHHPAKDGVFGVQVRARPIGDEAREAQHPLSVVAFMLLTVTCLSCIVCALYLSADW